ncbi:LysR family transcriptional regulator [Saccharopolyspora hattusasensis]|uniref:LysR family transcriptional regulator n=1 Tax=Saccharopolyspora hattusasensis TaxID=1128679 RepID=UPI003D95E643
MAEEGHFGHAADRLGMTQPPLSQGVQRLEARLGVTLLTRGSRGVRLTTAGAELLPRDRALLDGPEQFEEEARPAGEPRRGAHRGRRGVERSAGRGTDGRGAGCRARSGGAHRDHHHGCHGRPCRCRHRRSARLCRVHPPALIGALQSGPIRKIPRSPLVPADHPAARCSSRCARWPAWPARPRHAATGRRRSTWTRCAARGSTRSSCPQRVTATR